MPEYLARYTGLTVHDGESAGEASHQRPFYEEWRFAAPNQKIATDSVVEYESILKMRGNIEIVEFLKVKDIKVPSSGKPKSRFETDHKNLVYLVPFFKR